VVSLFPILNRYELRGAECFGLYAAHCGFGFRSCYVELVTAESADTWLILVSTFVLAASGARILERVLSCWHFVSLRSVDELNIPLAE
jgi:hypothetical protein